MRHGRSFPIKPHLPPAIVGAPVAVFLAPRPLVVGQVARQMAARLWSERRRHPILPPRITPPAPAVPTPPIATRPYIVSQAIRKARLLTGAVRPSPTVAAPIVATSYTRAALSGQLITIRAGITL